jgi:hypothetical protein
MDLARFAAPIFFALCVFFHMQLLFRYADMQFCIMILGHFFTFLRNDLTGADVIEPSTHSDHQAPKNMTQVAHLSRAFAKLRDTKIPFHKFS